MQHIKDNFREFNDQSTLWQKIELIESEGLSMHCIQYIASILSAIVLNTNCRILALGLPLEHNVIIDELNQHLVICGPADIGTVVRQVVPRFEIHNTIDNVEYGIGPYYHEANPPLVERVSLTPEPD